MGFVQCQCHEDLRVVQRFSKLCFESGESQDVPKMFQVEHDEMPIALIVCQRAFATASLIVAHPAL